jgi:hypothetical protein
MNVVAKELERIGLRILPQDETSNIRGENVITALTTAGVSLRLSVDDLEEMYKVDGTQYPAVVHPQS